MLAYSDQPYGFYAAVDAHGEVLGWFHLRPSVADEQMLELGYRPVGRDFPVFLHPQTHEEYALARTERKSGRGYRGFQIYAAPDVTLQDDLARRDLTINAMARAEDGTLIDPFHGADDIRAKVLRHVGPAFTEDPVRVLRVARFAARLGFDIAAETMALMRSMVEDGEVDHLVAERVWQEFSRGLMTQHPARMFAALRDCGALSRVLPELDRLFGVPQPARHHPEIDTGAHVMRAIELAARRDETLEVRFALLVHDLGKGTTPPEEWPAHIGHEARSLPLIEAMCERLRVPVACKELALAVARWHTHVHRALELRPETTLKMLEQCDAFRRRNRFELIVRACECDARARAGLEDCAYPQAERVRMAARAAAEVDTGAIARATPESSQIRSRVHEARLHAIRHALR
ncbi:MAG: multifunctional CCA addition/repair protein [Betaproteobacteria bacterium]|nr:MAG: multifunctional CCA addition/repair protein [Betaproteobacteria bacterium]